MKSVKITGAILLFFVVLSSMKGIKRPDYPVDPSFCSRYAITKVVEQGGDYYDYYQDCMEGRANVLP